MNKRSVLLVALVLVAMLAVSSVALAKTYKFTFEGVTLTDDAGTIDNGIIEAASKRTQTNKNNPDGEAFTNCDYYTADWAEYLGQYQSDSFFSNDAAEVNDFCQVHYPDRVQ